MKLRLKKEHRPIILILLFALALRIIFFTGINFNDDLTYTNFAHDVVEGKFSPHPYIFATRLMMIYPIALLFFLFGISDFTVSIYILLTSLGSVLLTYLIGKELFNIRTGLVAAFLIALLPLEIIYATTIVPDVPLALYLGLSMYLFIKGSKNNKNILYYLSGIAIGLAWLVKTIALAYCLVLIAIFIKEILIDKKKVTKAIKPYLLVLLGLLTILALEGLLYLSYGYSMFTVFNVNNELYTPTVLGINKELSYYPHQLFNYNIDKYFHYLGFYFIFAIISIILVVKRMQK